MQVDRSLQVPDFGIGRLFWAIHEAIIVGDTDTGRIVLFNPAAEGLFGYSAAEAAGQLLEILVAERFRPQHRAGIVRYRSTGHGAIVDGGAPAEVLAVTKAGREFSVELSLSPIEAIGHTGRFVLAVIRDITERQQVAEARAGERYFRTLTDTAPVMVWIAETDGSCTYFNKPWLEFTGRSMEAESGTGWADGIHAEDASRCLAAYRTAFAQHETFRIEYRLRRADGEYRWILDTGIPRYDPDGRFLGYIGSAIDITERKRAEDSTRFLADVGAVLANSLDLKVTLDSVAKLAVPFLADWAFVELLQDDGSIKRVAIAHQDPKKLALARKFDQQYPLDPAAVSGSAQVIRTGQSELIPEIPDALFQAVAQDEGHLQLLRGLGFRSSIIVPLRARGRIFGDLAFATDGSSGRHYGPDDLALAEELAHRAAQAVDNARLYLAAQEAIRSREDFLSVAAHELKTPLTSLVGYLQLLSSRLRNGGQLDPARARRALEASTRQSLKLARLIGQLLDVGRVESGQLRLETRRTDLGQLVEDTVEDARVRTEQHVIKVHHAGQLFAVVDPLRIEQVVTNLLDNAIKYSPAGTEIEVALTHARSGVAELSVRDYGVGIPPERRTHIFERFYRAHGDTHASGMGIGLYISRQIVELHAGELRAEFPAEGGTRFVVRLPIGRADAPGLGSVVE